MKRRSLDVIFVFRSPSDKRKGVVVAGPLRLRCALGRGGMIRDKREGDGGTPVASLKALGVHYRPDRTPRPRTSLPLVRIGKADGWCDDSASRLYNRPIRLPAHPSHERMWRDDALYDIVVDLSWNRRPIRRGRGSAIFLHSARPDFTPTEGCVAVGRAVIARLVERIGPRTRIVVRG
ncbi:L,D-transpeptidase family protein [Enterovirga rhinocerotis]|uniref:L,D-peptidoglycan transpeptidase YkuD (ErfK/YbiS/YcfS/YnhG family) n=1 Tax=Enterovirga rhinocerotis TaxID=1339210 RepID=A0A4R7BRP0_9HYPH|nr:L,D-transpeptidase family protein [Enterovirga rhinocerotis]TDR87125.1 L,D-peptidoglycan transpeptidase YkuD (ErfK/YbiS/YcfS/YnhG family) [Enterovirga rhinocerotis]